MTTMFKWIDGTDHDFDGLPDVSKAAILSRVIGHFRNECASAMIGWAKRQIVGPDGKLDGVTSEQAKAYRDEHPDETKAAVEAYFADKLAAIKAGTLGVRAEGGASSVDPLTTEMQRIATEEAKALLAAHNLKLPTKDGTITVAGTAMTRADLVARHLAKHAERIERDARKALAEKARKAKALTEANADLAAAFG